MRRVVAIGEGETLESRPRIGSNVDPIPVVVECNLVQQVGVDGVGGVNYCAVGGVAERVAYRWHIGATPLAHAETLRHLLRDEVAKDRPLAGESVIDAPDFFCQ